MEKLIAKSIKVRNMYPCREFYCEDDISGRVKNYHDGHQQAVLLPVLIEDNFASGRKNRCHCLIGTISLFYMEGD